MHACTAQLYTAQLSRWFFFVLKKSIFEFSADFNNDIIFIMIHAASFRIIEETLLEIFSYFIFHLKWVRSIWKQKMCLQKNSFQSNKIISFDDYFVHWVHLKLLKINPLLCIANKWFQKLVRLIENLLAFPPFYLNFLRSINFKSAKERKIEWIRITCFTINTDNSCSNMGFGVFWHIHRGNDFFSPLLPRHFK